MTQNISHDLGASPVIMTDSSEGELRRFNILVGCHRTFAFSWAGKPASLRFTRADEAPAPRSFLRVQVGDHSLDLGLHALPQPSKIGPSFAGIEIDNLPEDLLLAVLEAWLEEPVAALSSQDISLQLGAWHNESPRQDARFGWRIDWDGQEAFLAGTLHAHASVLDMLAGLALRSLPKPARSADEIPFPVSVALASLPLPGRSLAELGVGDVLLPPLTRALLAQGACELWTANRPLATARRQQSSIQILNMKQSTDPKAAAQTGSLGVDELPVQVLFDVGQIELSVGQLRTIGQGYTFELPHMQDRLVTLRANGREIGQGELVDIGDKVGVRITTWNLK